jgi:hypothetical protein
MSSGCRHQGGFGINSQVLDRYLKSEGIQRELYSFRNVDKEYDIPYTGGYSKDGSTIYFDRHLPDTIKLERDGEVKEVNPFPYLLMHESLEKTLIDQLGFKYEHAHQLATAYERRGVLQGIGPGWWDPYQKALAKYIKADQHEKLSKIPKDLDLTPYQDEHDEILLEHMRKVMNKGRKGKSKRN